MPLFFCYSCKFLLSSIWMGFLLVQVCHVASPLPGQEGLPAGHHGVSSQHLKGGRLPGTVDAQQAKTLKREQGWGLSTTGSGGFRSAGNLSHLSRRNPDTESIHSRLLLPLKNLQDTWTLALQPPGGSTATSSASRSREIKTVNQKVEELKLRLKSDTDMQNSFLTKVQQMNSYRQNFRCFGKNSTFIKFTIPEFQM